MKTIDTYIQESLESDKEDLYDERIGPDRDNNISKTKKYPDAYKRAQELYDLWFDDAGPRWRAAHVEIEKRWPNKEYNGGDGVESAINIMWNSMEDHPDIDPKEMRELQEFIRTMMGDGIT